jgi:hypothetical protein
MKQFQGLENSGFAGYGTLFAEVVKKIRRKSICSFDTCRKAFDSSACETGT